jgi:thioredoxin 1
MKIKKRFIQQIWIFSLVFLASLYPFKQLHAQNRIVDNVYYVTDAEFEDFIGSGLVLVDFWATWCGQCQQQSPIIDEIALEIGQRVKIGRLDVGANKVVSARFNIRHLPTIMIFKEGKLVDSFVGLTPKEALMDAIKNANY